MKKIILGLIASLVFIGCSSDNAEKNVEAKIVIGKSLSNLGLKDQFEKAVSIKADTTKVIFAYTKDVAHTCNNYIEAQTPTYLADNKIQFIADVSSAPSLIRSMFILPGLQDIKHTVILLDDKDIAAPFRAGVDTEKIVVVNLENNIIKNIRKLNGEADLKEFIETK